MNEITDKTYPAAEWPDHFDPDGISVPNGNYFALPFTPEESALVLLSVPWDVTTSYGTGACQGPDAIIAASEQVDLYDYHHPAGYRKGIGSLPIDESLIEGSQLLRRDAEKVMAHLAKGGSVTDDAVKRKIARINEACQEMNHYVYHTTKQWLSEGKLIGLVGGDHSTPYGMIQALAEREASFGILHIDAHADLRKAYEGFTWSHASIMYNVMNDFPQVTNLVQVGIRDYSQGEADLQESDPRISVFTDFLLKERLYRGQTWDQQCHQIISQLPDKVHISFDIDGLTPDNCPGTGTPVPGGLTFQEAVYLLKILADSGKEIIGFDLTEVAPGNDSEWNANVGARMLFKLCNLILLHK